MRNKIINAQSFSRSSAISTIISKAKMEDIQNEFQGEVDPAAEFLARDQSELDEIGIGGQLDVADV